jgi:hypothetical protein
LKGAGCDQKILGKSCLLVGYEKVMSFGVRFARYKKSSLGCGKVKKCASPKRGLKYIKRVRILLIKI